MIRIESLLSARLFLSPQLVGERLFFVSNLSGRMSLYVMDHGGSVPEPLLPPDIALQNPDLIGGRYLFYVLAELGMIVVMLDKDGDENYQPMVIPLGGGFPEPAFGEQLAGYRVHLLHVDAARGLVYLAAESRDTPLVAAFRGDLRAGSLEKLGESQWGCVVDAVSADHRRVVLSDSYTIGDVVLYLWEQGERHLLYGTPLEEREPGASPPPSAIFDTHFTPAGLLFVTALFDDSYGLGYLPLSAGEGGAEVRPVAITGLRHDGAGELTHLDALGGDRYLVQYNIDGCSWAYEARFDEDALAMHVTRVICGEGPLAAGVLESIRHDPVSDRFALAFSTATTPTQLYTVAGAGRGTPAAQTRERVLGIPAAWLSPGEDASFTSHDGLRISARLYLPSPELGFEGRRPLVYYVHGGPQGQERPDFAWFSMPLIQLLTMRGFAVFVPNARGSTGYGLSYMKRVDHDWGGQDRLDHVYAMQHVLPKDDRIDVKRAGVVGRSYGGYMTLTLAGRHPELWRAAVDMFGPYNLLSFMERLPETWKPYFAIAVGDPETERDFLVERSPETYIDQIACPLLVIQGKNDPRVIERESRDVVERLQARGKRVEYLMFENEGHDVLKFENRVACYNAIAEFFAAELME